MMRFTLRKIGVLYIQIIGLGILVFCGFLLKGCQPQIECTDPAGCINFKKGQSIKIAAVLPFSGDRYCPQAIESAKAVQMSIKQQKSISGHSLEYIQIDTFGSELKHQQILGELLTEPQILFIFDFSCVPNELNNLKIITDALVPVMTNSSVNTASPANGVYTLRQDPMLIARQIQSILSSLTEHKNINIYADKLPYSALVSSAICEEFSNQSSSCTFQTIDQVRSFETIQNQTTLDLWIVDTTAIPLDKVSQSSAKTLIIYDPYLQSPGNPVDKNGDLYWIGPVPVKSNQEQINQKFEKQFYHPIQYADTYQAYDAAEWVISALRTSGRADRTQWWLPRGKYLNTLSETRSQGLTSEFACALSGWCGKVQLALYQFDGEHFIMRHQPE